MLARQMPDAEKRRRAHIVVDTERDARSNPPAGRRHRPRRGPGRRRPIDARPGLASWAKSDHNSRIMREIVIDTETTGLDAASDRIVEVGCVELLNHIPSGQRLPVLRQPGAADAGRGGGCPRAHRPVPRRQAAVRRDRRRADRLHRRRDADRPQCRVRLRLPQCGAPAARPAADPRVSDDRHADAGAAEAPGRLRIRSMPSAPATTSIRAGGRCMARSSMPSSSPRSISS